MAIVEEKLDTNPGSEAYPEYVPGKWYYRGNKITFKGNRHICDAPDGVVCVWDPEQYPTYWKMAE